MKQYNLFESKKARQFNWGEMTIISLGERGRGRYEEVIPYADNIESEVACVELATTKSGKQKIVLSHDEEGWLALLSANGTYTRGTYGTCKTPTPDRVEVITKGYGAFGDAGRTGTYYEFLAKVEANTWVFIRPAGGETKRHRYWLYFSDDQVFKVSKSDLEMFCDSKGLDVPDIETLVDLA